MRRAYQDIGYEVSYNPEFLMLEVRKGLVHASFNPLKIDGRIAEWKHIGDQGSVFFPADWLDANPRNFYGVQVFTSGIKFEYAVKSKVSMLHPVWQLREKDIAALQRIKELLRTEGICDEDVYRWFWSYNPYWYQKGYDEFFRPTIAWPIEPK